MIDSHHHLLLLLSPQNQCRDGSRTNSLYPGPSTLLQIHTFSNKASPSKKISPIVEPIKLIKFQLNERNSNSIALNIERFGYLHTIIH